MRRILLGGTAAFALLAGQAGAGGIAEPVTPATVVEAQTSSSGAGLIVPLLILIVLAAAVGGGGNGAGGGVVVSDRRAKTDISWVGMAQGNLPIYRYRYAGMSTRFEGVMAQDVLQNRPEAVLQTSEALMRVDYAKLGLKLRVLH